MDKKIPDKRLKELKEDHKKKKKIPKEDKYQTWLKCSLPIFDDYCGQYTITDWFRKIV